MDLSARLRRHGLPRPRHRRAHRILVAGRWADARLSLGPPGTTKPPPSRRPAAAAINISRAAAAATRNCRYDAELLPLPLVCSSMPLKRGPRRRLLDADAGPVGVELFGQDHRQQQSGRPGPSRAWSPTTSRHRPGRCAGRRSARTRNREPHRARGATPTAAGDRTRARGRQRSPSAESDDGYSLRVLRRTMRRRAQPV